MMILDSLLSKIRNGGLSSFDFDRFAAGWRLRLLWRRRRRRWWWLLLFLLLLLLGFRGQEGLLSYRASLTLGLGLLGNML